MEMFDIYNEDGSSAAYAASRSDAHRRGLWHRTVHIWIVNNKGMLLLQKRSLDKETYPGYWDISCAGHIDAGESAIDAAIRELSEELGLNVSSDLLLYLFTIRQQYKKMSPKIIDNEFSDVFLLRYDKEISIGNNELTDLQYVKVSQLTDGTVCPLAEHEEEYTMLQKRLKNSSKSDFN